MRRCAGLVILLVMVCGCGSPNLEGEWELIDAKTGQVFGDVMTVSGEGRWHRTGFPPMAGTYEWADGKVSFKITDVAGVNRTEMAEQNKIIDVGSRLDQVEKQMVFLVEQTEFGPIMKQASPVQGLVEIKFQKKRT